MIQSIGKSIGNCPGVQDRKNIKILLFNIINFIIKLNININILNILLFNIKILKYPYSDIFNRAKNYFSKFAIP